MSYRIDIYTNTPHSTLEELQEFADENFLHIPLLEIAPSGVIECDIDYCEHLEFIEFIDNRYRYRVYSGNERLYRCEDSWEWFPLCELREDIAGNLIREDIWEDLYYECSGCGRVDNIENARSCCYGPLVCESCDYESIQYFSGPRKTFSGTNSFGSSRSFGIELETQRGRCDTCYSFDGKDDGSIDGTEYVSHILRGDDGLAELRNFMASGDEIDIDDSCGVHLHCNVSDLSDSELYATYCAYLLTYSKWVDRVDCCREGHDYCFELPESRIREARIAYNHEIPFSVFISNFDRYEWLNVKSFLKHNTLENRLHHGSWNYPELEKWIKLNLRFIRASRRISMEQDFSDFRTDAFLAFEWADGASNTLASEVFAETAV